MKNFPALDLIHPDPDRLLAELDEHGPTAIEERPNGIRAFFSTDAARAGAARALAAICPVQALDVSDEDWARRSQEHLTAVSVGRLIVTPPWLPAHADLVVVINPSMGFGTGHHATTRLCLDALQRADVAGRSVLDVGTGSGVLALAAALLGAAPVAGIDNDRDAIASARENLSLNPRASGVRFMVTDLAAFQHSPVDVAVANLTGALLARAADTLKACVRPAGRLIVSGLLEAERADVTAAFGTWAVESEMTEDGWAALVFRSAGKV